MKATTLSTGPNFRIEIHGTEVHIVILTATEADARDFGRKAGAQLAQGVLGMRLSYPIDRTLN